MMEFCALHCMKGGCGGPRQSAAGQSPLTLYNLHTHPDHENYTFQSQSHRRLHRERQQ
jgi:hypothetical protein